MKDRSSDWERLDNDTYRTITGSPGGITVCWEKWWVYDQGLYLCLWGSAEACPVGASITFVRWWQDPGNGIDWGRSGQACVAPSTGMTMKATELLVQVKKPLPPVQPIDPQNCPTTTKGPENGLVLVPTKRVLYQGVHYAVASVVLNLTEVRLPTWCPARQNYCTKHF